MRTLKHIVIFITLGISFLSCVHNKPLSHGKEIAELRVVDTAYFKQLVNIIFTSSCFEMYKTERQIITLIYDPNLLFMRYPDLLYINFRTYCGVNECDLEQIYGGFYYMNNNTKYLFIIRNTKEVPVINFETTGNYIDVSEHMGDMKGSDSEIGLSKIDGQLKIIYTNCSGYE